MSNALFCALCSLFWWISTDLDFYGALAIIIYWLTWLTGYPIVQSIINRFNSSDNRL